MWGLPLSSSPTPPMSPSTSPGCVLHNKEKYKCLGHNKSPNRLSVINDGGLYETDTGLVVPHILATVPGTTSGTHEKWRAEGAQSTTKPPEGVYQGHKFSQRKQCGFPLLPHVYNVIPGLVIMQGPEQHQRVTHFSVFTMLWPLLWKHHHHPALAELLKKIIV